MRKKKNYCIKKINKLKLLGTNLVVKEVELTNSSLFVTGQDNGVNTIQLVSVFTKSKVLNIPEGIDIIEKLDFCDTVEVLIIPSSVLRFNFQMLLVNYFPNLRSVVFNEGSKMTFIGAELFARLNYLESVILPDSCTFLYNSCFASSSIKTLDLPNTLIEIRAYAFKYSNIEIINLPSGLREIGINAFRNCSYLTSITLPKSLKVCTLGAFRESAIEEITLECKIQNFASDFKLADFKYLKQINCDSLDMFHYLRQALPYNIKVKYKYL